MVKSQKSRPEIESLEAKLKIVQEQLREAEKDVLRRPPIAQEPSPISTQKLTKPDRVGRRKLREPIVLKAKGAGV